MGMYTQFQFSAELDYNKASDILPVLRYMTGDETVNVSDFNVPDHDLFKTDRWHYMLNSSSYYFASTTHSDIVVNNDFQLITLTVICDLKNYEHEIEKFCDWIRPYVQLDKLDENGKKIEFVGYKRYETEIDPSFIYFTEDCVKFVKPAELHSR